MKEIKSSNGYIIQISDEDYDRVIAAGNWFAAKSADGKRFYVYRKFGRKGPRFYLHRWILNYEGPDDIDHDDGNGLNCTRENMIIKSRSWNNFNNHNVRSNNQSGVTGIYYDKSWLVWKVEIKINNKKYRIGNFNTKEEAIVARRIAEEDVKSGREPQPSPNRIQRGKKQCP